MFNYVGNTSLTYYSFGIELDYFMRNSNCRTNLSFDVYSDFLNWQSSRNHHNKTVSNCHYVRHHDGKVMRFNDLLVNLNVPVPFFSDYNFER